MTSDQGSVQTEIGGRVRFSFSPAVVAAIVALALGVLVVVQAVYSPDGLEADGAPAAENAPALATGATGPSGTSGQVPSGDPAALDRKARADDGDAAANHPLW